MSKIPNFTMYLRKDLIPILEKAQLNFEVTIELMKEECLVFENYIQPDQPFIELA